MFLLVSILVFVELELLRFSRYCCYQVSLFALFFFVHGILCVGFPRSIGLLSVDFLLVLHREVVLLLHYVSKSVAA